MADFQIRGIDVNFDKVKAYTLHVKSGFAIKNLEGKFIQIRCKRAEYDDFDKAYKNYIKSKTKDLNDG